jgi:hypothetical protein
MNATATFATDQAVIVRIPGGRTREGVYVGTTDAGKITVRYSNAAGEKTADFKAVDVRPVEVEDQPAPADETPVVDVNDDVTEPATDAEPVEAQGPHTKDECEDLDGCTAEHLPAAPVANDAPAARKSTKKGFMPAGWVTPVGLTKVINERGLYPGEGELGGIYNPIAASEKAGVPFPGLYDHEGYKVIVEVETGIAWYVAWTKRQAERHANAAERRERPRLTDEEKAARAEARTATKALRAAEDRLFRAERAAERAAQRVEEAKLEVEAARKAAQAVAPAADDDAADEETAEA